MYAQSKINVEPQSKITFYDGADYVKTPVNNNAIYTPVKTDIPKTGRYVDVKFKYRNEPGTQVVQGVIFNKDYKQVVFFDKSSEPQISVPEGTYDMYTIFSGGTFYFVFKENIEVKDGDVYEFVQTDAKHATKYKFYNENDKRILVDGPDAESSASDMSKYTSFIQKDYGSAGLIIGKGFTGGEESVEFYVNDLSDKYVIGNGTLIEASGKIYSFKDAFTYDMSKFEEVRTIGGSENIIKATTHFNTKNLMDDEDAIVEGFDFHFTYKGKPIFSVASLDRHRLCPEQTMSHYLCAPESDVNSNDNVNVLLHPVISNYYIEEEIIEGKLSKTFYGVRGPAMVGDKKSGVKYILSGCDKSMTGFNTPEESKYPQFYPGHPDFNFESATGELDIMNCCPVTAINAKKYISYGNIKGWEELLFSGRHGECYESESKIITINQESGNDGMISCTVINDLVEVDGIKGKNVTEYVYDSYRDDINAPTLQFVTFKDAEGNMTDRLPVAAGSKLIFTGGDFTYHSMNRNKIGYYTCDKAEVTVRYSETGKEEWKDLVVTEVPEKFFMPYFGNYYEVSLDPVKYVENDKWFDLEFFFTDAAGNTHKQTMTPAFKIIKGDSGINEIEESNSDNLVIMAGNVRLSNGETADFKVVNMMGTVVRKANSNEINIEGLQDGIYLVVAKSAEHRTMTKKIVIK